MTDPMPILRLDKNTSDWDFLNDNDHALTGVSVMTRICGMYKCFPCCFPQHKVVACVVGSCCCWYLVPQDTMLYNVFASSKRYCLLQAKNYCHVSLFTGIIDPCLRMVPFFKKLNVFRDPLKIHVWWMVLHFWPNLMICLVKIDLDPKTTEFTIMFCKLIFLAKIE